MTVTDAQAFSGRTPSTKDEWRAHVLAERRMLDAAQRSVETIALCHAAAELVVNSAGKRTTSPAEQVTVAAYVPVGREPGSPEMLDAMAAAGARIFLPIAREPGPLRWALYRGPQSLVSAPFGLTEPDGPVLAPETVAECSLVLVPALAVDRRGTRLGRGAGFYDRTLDLCDAGASSIAVVRDSELVDRLPGEPHDRPVTHALTPAAGFVRLRTE